MGYMRSAVSLLVLVSFCIPVVAAKEAGKPPGKAIARELRAEWELGELKLTREAVDDTSFKPAIKSKAIDALETFIAEQEQLIQQVEQSPEAEPKARKQRAKMEATFTKRMAVINDDPQLKRELAASVKAVNKEMDEMAASASTLFARLEQVGLTPEQKQQLKPVVDDASRNVRGSVEKSKSKSTKDRDNREAVVEKFKESRKKVKQHLTPEQREKLKQKLAEA